MINLKDGLVLFGLCALQITANLLDDWCDLKENHLSSLSKRKKKIWEFRQNSVFSFVLGLPFIVLLGFTSLLLTLWFLPSAEWILFYTLAVVLLISVYTLVPQRRAWLGLGELLVFLTYGGLIPLGLRLSLVESGSLPLVFDLTSGFFALLLLWSNHLEDYVQISPYHRWLSFSHSKKIFGGILICFKLGLLFSVQFLGHYYGQSLSQGLWFLFFVFFMTMCIDLIKFLGIIRTLEEASLRLAVITSGLRDLVIAWTLIYRSRFF
jgi:hypothetical protein